MGFDLLMLVSLKAHLRIAAAREEPSHRKMTSGTEPSEKKER
jgi:hypothetical protein